MVRFGYVLMVLLLGKSLDSTAQNTQQNSTDINQEVLPVITASIVPGLPGSSGSDLLISIGFPPELSRTGDGDPFFKYIPALLKPGSDYLYSKSMEHDGSSGFHLDDLKYRLFQVPVVMCVGLAVREPLSEKKLDTYRCQGINPEFCVLGESKA